MENVFISPTPLIARTSRSLVCLRNPRLRALVLTLPAA